MKKFCLLLLSCLFFVCIGSGAIAFAAEGGTGSDDLEMRSVLRVNDGYAGAGTAQIRTAEAQTGQYSLTYSVSGASNDWIAQQYIGLDDAGTYILINLFVTSNITVSKVSPDGVETLQILDAATDEPMSSTRSYELGGDWFNGPEYIFKYEITETRLNFYFGYASKIVDGTDAPAGRGYVLLDDDTYGEYTDGVAAFAPYAAGAVGYSLTVNSMAVDGNAADLDLSGMEMTQENVLASDTAVVFAADQFANYHSAGVDFAKGDTFRRSWVSEVPVPADEMPAGADVFTASFEIDLTTSDGGYILEAADPLLRFGFSFGMPTREATEETDGVTTLFSKLPYATLGLSVGNGTEAVPSSTILGTPTELFSTNITGIRTLYIQLVGDSDGLLTVTFRANAGAHLQGTEYTFEGVDFNGYVSFFVEANNVDFQPPNASGSFAFNNITLPSTEVVDAAAITLSADRLAVRAGDSVQLSAEVEPFNATLKAVEWTSSDDSVATVDADGNVTAHAAGRAVITAETHNGLQASCSVLVSVDETGVTLNKTSVQIGRGRTLQLTAAVSPADATYPDVTWSSSDAEIAAVDPTGLVTGVKEGKAVIKAITSNGLEATCEVTVVVPVESISLDRNSVSLAPGETATLTASVLPQNAGNKTVFWVTSASNVATVEQGVVTAVGAGSAVISVVCEDGRLEASCTVTVTAPEIPVSGIALNETQATLEIGGTVVLKATVTPADATDQTIAWSSSDSSVAVVNEHGIVTAIAAGTATITATSAGGQTASFVVAVNAAAEESGGCNSSMAVSAPLVGLAAAGAAVVLISKKGRKDHEKA